MQNAPVINLMRTIRVVSPEDIVGRAAEQVRVSGIFEVPVVSAGRLVGIVSEAAILDSLASGDPLTAAEQPIKGIMTSQITALLPHTTIGEAAKILDAEGVQALPVVNECGLYMGVVTRGDVIGALCLTIRPPSVGGLATPLGVYLTTGNHRGGTSDFGLFLTGVTLGLLRYAAAAIVAGVLWLIQKATGVGVLAMLIDQSAHKSQLADILSSSAIIIALVLFGVLLRISPLSGFHAAEHQVVNAIENGEPLKPEFVSRMPRVHPRCGTNLLVAVMIFLMIGDGFGNDVAVLLTIFVLIFAWRTIGGYFQNYVTTKPPSLRQIESGIRAGKEVVSSYRKNPALRVNAWRRIWYTGMPQVMAGMMLTTAFDTYMRGIFPGLF